MNCKLELNCVEFTLFLGSLLLPTPSIPITEVPSITLTNLLLVSLIPWIVFTFCLGCLGEHINPGWIWLKTWAAETKEQISQDYVCQWYYKSMFTTNKDPHILLCFSGWFYFLLSKVLIFNILHFPEGSNSSGSFLLSVNGLDFNEENRGYQLKIPPNFWDQVWQPAKFCIILSLSSSVTMEDISSLLLKASFTTCTLDPIGLDFLRTLVYPLFLLFCTFGLSLCPDSSLSTLKCSSVPSFKKNPSPNLTLSCLSSLGANLPEWVV